MSPEESSASFTVKTEDEARFIANFLVAEKYMFLVEPLSDGKYSINARSDKRDEVIQRLASAPGVSNITVVREL